MIRSFRLHRPATIAEAATLLRELPDAAAYWGGTELLQVMKLGFARPANLVDLKRIDALRGIGVSNDASIGIGAGTTHREVDRSEIVRHAYPGLARLAGRIANPRVRNVGSLGGNLCFAEPHSDPAAFLLAAGATLDLAGPEGERELTIDAFVVDAFETALGPGELLRSIHLPPPQRAAAVAHQRIAFAERPAVAVACRLRLDGDVVSEARIAVASLGPRPALAPEAASVLVGTPRTELEAAAVSAADVLAARVVVEEDPTLSSEFRRHLAGVLLRRAVGDAAAMVDGR